MMMPIPYFLKNKEWYEEIPSNKEGCTRRIVLTEKGKSIPEVVESYKEWTEDMEDFSIDESGELY